MTTSIADAFEIDDLERDHPSDRTIEALRRRFPTELEQDRMLTRKMRRRALVGAERTYELRELVAALEQMLRSQLTHDFEVRDPCWLTGGASKIQMGFDLLEHVDGRTVASRLVLRMEPLESLNSTSRRREFEVIRAMEGVVPVPAVRWLDDDARWFPEPALVYTRVEGSPKPARSESRIAGIGIAFGPTLREQLGQRFVEMLARIHTAPLDHTALASYSWPEVGSTESALWQLNRARRVWEEDRGEQLPLLDVAASWLEDNLPRLDVASMVHGDYRGGNFMFTEQDATITAVLDWERSLIGDRHRDLAWTTLPPFGHRAEVGGTFLVAGLVPEDEFYHQYEQASGLSIDPDRLRYYRILCCYQGVVTALGSAYRVSKLGRSHQDAVLTGLEATGQVIAHQLVRDLKEVL